MNCTLAAGIFDTQAVSPAPAAGVPTGQVQPEGADGASFLSFLGAQDPTQSVTVTPSLPSEPPQAAGAGQTALPPLTGRSMRVPESALPICLYPQAGGRLESSQPFKDDTVQIESPAPNDTPDAQPAELSQQPRGLIQRATPAETRASRAFRLEQTENTADAAQVSAAQASVPQASPLPVASSKTQQPEPVVSNRSAAKREEPSVEAPKLPAAETAAAATLLVQPATTPAVAAPAAVQPGALGFSSQVEPSRQPAVQAKADGTATAVRPPFQPAQFPSPRPVEGPAAAPAAALHTESQTFEEISAPETQEPASAPQRTDAAQASRPGSQSPSSQLAQDALTGGFNLSSAWSAGPAAGEASTERVEPEGQGRTVETPQAPASSSNGMTAQLEGRPASTPAGPDLPAAAAQPVALAETSTEMHTALRGMLTVVPPSEETNSAPAPAHHEPGAFLSLLKTAESDAINRRAFDTVRTESAQPQFTPRTGAGAAYSFAPAASETAAEQPSMIAAPAPQPQAASKSPAQAAAVPDIPVQPDPAAIPAPARMAASKLAGPVPAARNSEERTEKAVQSKPTQSTIAAPEAPRVQNAETPAKQDAIRPAPGAEMTRRIDALQTAQSAVRGSVHSFTIPIGQELNPVATLRLVQQSSGVQITVQTPDAALSQSMQANLPQLLRGLEDSGFKADFQSQPATHIETTSAPVRTTSTDNRQAGSFDQGNAQQEGPAHGQDREKRQPSHEWRQWLQHGRKQNKEGN